MKYILTYTCSHIHTPTCMIALNFCLMAYQFYWVTWSQSFTCRRALVLFNPLIGRIRGFMPLPRVFDQKLNAIVGLKFTLTHNSLAHWLVRTADLPNIFGYIYFGKYMCICVCELFEFPCFFHLHT